MLVVRNKSGTCVPVLSYECPESGKKIHCSNWSGFIYKIKQHRNSRKLPIPLNFERVIMHNWCVDHPECCKDENEPNVQPSHPAHTSKIQYPKLSDQLKSFLKDTAAWAKEGFKKSDRPLVEKRLAICVECEYWSGSRSFFNFRCKKCGCRMRIKVQRPASGCPEGKW